jgi:hypothetical protein
MNCVTLQKQENTEKPEMKEKHTELKLNILQESHDQALVGARKEGYSLPH